MPRRRKAQEQVDRGWDRRLEDRQQGGRFGQGFDRSKVRVDVRQQQHGYSRVTGDVRDHMGGNLPQLWYFHGGRRSDCGDGKAIDNGSDDIVDLHADNGEKRFVTFYITNFPKHANYWYLRKVLRCVGF